MLTKEVHGPQWNWSKPGAYASPGLHVCMLSHSVMSSSAIPWTVACQAPLSMGFSRQGYWSGLPCLPPGHLPNPGIQHTSLISPALAGISAYSLPLLLPGKPHILSIVYFYFSCKTNLESLCFLSFFSPIIA